MFYCNNKFDEHLWDCDDSEDPSNCNIISEDIFMEHAEPYKSRDSDYWWLELMDNKRFIFKFLAVLVVNPTQLLMSESFIYHAGAHVIDNTSHILIT